MTSLGRHVDAFQDLFLGAIATRPSPAPGFAREIALLQRHLPVGPGATTGVPPAALPACAHLPRAFADGARGAEAALVCSAEALAPALRWSYSYPREGRFAGLGDRLAFCEVVGFHGLRASDRVRLGLTLIAPDTAYPAHAHPAVETYLVISGTALWQAGEGPFVRRAPGAIIWHPSGVCHAMTTAAEPLLAVWSWTGDIVAPSVYTG